MRKQLTIILMVFILCGITVGGSLFLLDSESHDGKERFQLPFNMRSNAEYVELKKENITLISEYNKTLENGDIYDLIPRDVRADDYVKSMFDDVKRVTGDIDSAASNYGFKSKLSETVENLRSRLKELEKNLSVKDNGNFKHARLSETELIANYIVAARDNSYRHVAVDLPKLMGAEAVFDYKNASERCQHSNFDSGADFATETVAYVCSIEPKRIYVNTEDTGSYNHLFFADAIKHELAHLAILDTCSVLTPDLTNDDEIEGVTSSYAVLFFNANKESLENMAVGNNLYAMSDRTYDIARKIYNGECRG